MTKKHFEIVTNTIRFQVERKRRDAGYEGYWTLARVVSNLCVEFKKINARFDSVRFKVACGFAKGEIE